MVQNSQLSGGGGIPQAFHCACLLATSGQHEGWVVPWGTLCSGVGSICLDGGHVWFLSPNRAQGPLPGPSPQPAAGIVLQHLTIAHSSRSFEEGCEDWLLEARDTWKSLLVPHIFR